MTHSFKADDIVWVNLGKPYGWWPGQVQDNRKKVKLSDSIIEGLGQEYSNINSDETVVYVKFFDDDSFEWVGIKDIKRIQAYSCKNKKKFIKAGFKSLDENTKSTLGGTNLRLAQFYKDVELAEVLTDNDADVANILSEYEISEVDVAIEESNEEETHEGTSSGQTQKTEKKDVLKEIKNGGVGKRRKKRKAKK